MRYIGLICDWHKTKDWNSGKPSTTQSYYMIHCQQTAGSKWSQENLNVTESEMKKNNLNNESLFALFYGKIHNTFSRRESCARRAVLQIEASGWPKIRWNSRRGCRTRPISKTSFFGIGKSCDRLQQQEGIDGRSGSTRMQWNSHHSVPGPKAIMTKPGNVSALKILQIMKESSVWTLPETSANLDTCVAHVDVHWPMPIKIITLQST